MIKKVIPILVIIIILVISITIMLKLTAKHKALVEELNSAKKQNIKLNDELDKYKDEILNIKIDIDEIMWNRGLTIKDIKKIERKLNAKNKSQFRKYIMWRIKQEIRYFQATRDKATIDFVHYSNLLVSFLNLNPNIKSTKRQDHSFPPPGLK